MLRKRLEVVIGVRRGVAGSRLIVVGEEYGEALVSL